MTYKIVVTKLHKKFKYPIGKKEVYNYKNKQSALDKICLIEKRAKKQHIMWQTNISHKKHKCK